MGDGWGPLAHPACRRWQQDEPRSHGAGKARPLWASEQGYTRRRPWLSDPLTKNLYKLYPSTSNVQHCWAEKGLEAQPSSWGHSEVPVCSIPFLPMPGSAAQGQHTHLMCNLSLPSLSRTRV